MPVFLRYLAILLIHIIWEHIGGRGPVPPIRVPRKNPVTVPTLSTWQALFALWLVKKLWESQGKKVGDKVQERAKDSFGNARATVGRRVGDWKAARAARSKAKPTADTAPNAPESPAPVAAFAASETATPTSIPSPIPGMPHPANG